MIKRTNKIAGMLTLASLISMAGQVNVSADTYPRIDTQDGTIYEAFAYKDGKFYIDGDIEEAESEGVFYLNNENFDQINDIDSGSEPIGTYSDKYIEFDDDYYFDMSNGEISEDSLIEDTEDDAFILLRKNIRKTAEDRYEDLNSDLIEIPRIKFSESWYTSNFNGYTVFSDSKGNYIDADYNLGKIKVVTTGNSVTVTNSEDKKEGTRAYVSDSNVIGQDAEYIYRTVKITIESDEVINKIDTIDVNSGDGFDISENDGKTVSFEAIQKISKEQSEDKIDGANYAKKAVTYVLTGLDGIKVSLLDNAKISIVDGDIVEYIEESGELTIQTLSLYEERGTQNYVYAYNVDPEEVENIDIDSKGNLWKVKDGAIYKFDNYSEWDKMYKVDGAMDSLSVYDENYIITWSDDVDIYAIRAESKSEVIKEEVVGEDVLAEKTGWIKNADGSWSYIKIDKSNATGWIKDNDTWYYLNSNGVMQTGWINENGRWYYLESSGAMKTGWFNDGGKWYYLNISGEMLYNTVVDGYELSENGQWNG